MGMITGDATHLPEDKEFFVKGAIYAANFCFSKAKKNCHGRGFELETFSLEISDATSELCIHHS